MPNPSDTTTVLVKGRLSFIGGRYRGRRLDGTPIYWTREVQEIEMSEESFAACKADPSLVVEIVPPPAPSLPEPAPAPAPAPAPVAESRPAQASQPAYDPKRRR